MTHSTLLILGGGVLASLLAALIFSPRSSGEDKQAREMRKLMTALEAQRRIRDAQQARELRQGRPLMRPPAMSAYAPARVADPQTPPPAVAPRPTLVPPAEPYVEQPDRRSAEKERKAALAAEQAERRASEQQRKREAKEQAAARKAELAAEKRARREAEQEHKAALAAEQAERRAAEQQRKREEKEQAAAREAELDVELEARRHAEREAAGPAPLIVERAAEVAAEAARPLTEGAQRDLDEIARWREEDDRRAAAKAAKSRRRVSERLYKRQQEAHAAAEQSEREAAVHARRVEEERRAAREAEEVERAAALESSRRAEEEEARRPAEEERAMALEADEARAPWTATPDHMAALNAERHALELQREELRIAEQDAKAVPDPPDDVAGKKPSRLADLPLYSWANANEDEDEASTGKG